MKRLAPLLLSPLLLAAALAHPAAARPKTPGEAAPEPPADAQAVPLPAPRPDAAATETPAAPAEAAKPAEQPSEAKPEGPPTIEKTDKRLYQTACPAIVSGVVEAKLMPPIEDGVCGTHSPYAVSAIHAGGTTIALKGKVVLNCQMATALAEWVDAIAPAAAVIVKSPLKSIRIGTSYQCRRRYGAADGPISEHAFADAVDMMGFSFADGSKVTVEADWAGDGVKTQFLHLAHDTACGDFTTVLGPEANAAHKNHFHLDLSCHGKTCTYRICE